MNRRSSILAALTLFASLSGCAMCQSPFDYCGPVIGPGGEQSCNFNARRGSIFEPMDDSADTQMAPTLAPTATDSVEYSADEEAEADAETVDYEAPAEDL
jgi:hypothetical protein